MKKSLKIQLTDWKIVIIVTFMLLSLQTFTAENPFKDVRVERVKSSVVKEFNRFTFLESILSGADGSIYTTSIMEGIIYRTKDGKISKLTKFNGRLVGITFLDDENILATGETNQKEPIILKVNVITGESKIVAKISEAVLLNGILKLNKNTLLIADSFKGVIWKVDIKSGLASIWLDHELAASPNEGVPGVNGIKMFNNHIYFSNTGKMLIVKIPLNKNGSARTPKIVSENVFVDDFTMDRTGNIFGATHIYNSVIKINPKGDVSIIAQYDQGVTGSTCVTWEYGSSDTLLISAHGGMTNSDKSTVTPAKIVKLKLK